MLPVKEWKGRVRFEGPSTSIDLVPAPKEEVNLSTVFTLLKRSKVSGAGPGFDSLKRVSVDEVQEKLLIRLRTSLIVLGPKEQPRGLALVLIMSPPRINMLRRRRLERSLSRRVQMRALLVLSASAVLT